MNKKRWYAVRTLANKEEKALENLNTELELNSNINKFVGNIVLPKEKKYKLKDGKRIVTEKLLFSNYIFIETSAIAELNRFIKGIKYVVGFSGDRKGTPIPLRKKEVENILKVKEENESEEVVEKIPFLVGEKVTINEGPFESFEGSVSSINEDKKEIDVDVKIFGRITNVKLSYLQVEKVF